MLHLPSKRQKKTFYLQNQLNRKEINTYIHTYSF